MSTLTGSKITITLTPPPPFLNACYPLLEPHIIQLYKISEKGTILPTNVEEVAAKDNIDAESQKQFKEQLDEAALVYSTAKTHSVAYRGVLTKLFVELGDGIEIFFHSLRDNLLTKLLTFNLLTPISAIIDGLTDVLSALILKAGYIIDILNETSKSVVYGSQHIGTVVAGQAGKLLKSIDFQNDLNILGEVVPLTIRTVGGMLGGMCAILANLNTLKSANILTVASQFRVDLLPGGNVLTTWMTVVETSTRKQAELRDVLVEIRKTANAA